MTYVVTLSDGKYAGTYATREDAVESIRRHEHWTAVVLSPSYTVDGPRKASTGDTARAWSAYETQAACDGDETGARAPRIVEVA